MEQNIFSYDQQLALALALQSFAKEHEADDLSGREIAKEYLNENHNTFMELVLESIRNGGNVPGLLDEAMNSRQRLNQYLLLLDEILAPDILETIMTIKEEWKNGVRKITRVPVTQDAAPSLS